MMRMAGVLFLSLLGACVVRTVQAEMPRCVCLRPMISESARTALKGMVCAANAVKTVETQLDVVDIMLAFDSSAANWVMLNKMCSLDEYGNMCIDKMNDCLAASDMLGTFRFRLAGTIRIDQDLSGMDLNEVLDHFVDEYGHDVSKGACKVVAPARDAQGADIVSILVANGSRGTVGIGYSLVANDFFDFVGQPSSIVNFAPWAYNVCSIQAVDENYTLAHEVGHNMGAGHPDETCADPNRYLTWEWDSLSRKFETVVGGNLGPQLYGYSSGYYLWIDNVGYYTVMSYNVGGLDASGHVTDTSRFTPTPYFSSPNVRFGGVPVGTPVNDNRRTLLNTFKYVAQFRVAKLPADGEGAAPVDTSITIAGYTVEGAFNPEKAFNAVPPYVGVAYSNDVPVAIVQLKVGKANAKQENCKVSGTILGVTGIKYKINSQTVPTGAGPCWMEGVEIAKFGTLDLVLGANGFAGTCATSPFGALEIRTHALESSLAPNPVFKMDAVGDLEGVPVLVDCLPTNMPFTVKNAKWMFAKAAKVKFVKVKGEVPVLVVDEGRDHQNTNRSGLKLSYAAKNSSFKGSFTFFLRTGTDASPKIKKVKAAVTGLVVDGLGFGIALAKGVGTWPVTIE